MASSTRGMLKVTASTTNGTDYALNADTLSVNNGFTGTITSTATFSDKVQTHEIDFIYDHNGMRTAKIVSENGRVEMTEYTLHGKLITHLTKRVVDENGAESTEELHFFYDAQSTPAFVEYDGAMYRYVHNLQGDIVAIVDSSGAPVVEYMYDAWGKHVDTVPEIGIGAFNPFRYRGYVWDEENGLYYIRSRCYDASRNRFINSDSIIISAPKVGGMNVFTYCINEPIGTYDPNGQHYIDAFSVQGETNAQRKRAFAYTKATRPKKASKNLVAMVDKYFKICNQNIYYANYTRLSDVYMYNDGDTIYLSTIYGGFHCSGYSYLAKYQKQNITFKVSSHKSESRSNYLSLALFVISNSTGQQSASYSAIGKESEANQFNFVKAVTDIVDEAFEPNDWWNEPLFTYDSLGVVSRFSIS